jgi:hypothetical protein
MTADVEIRETWSDSILAVYDDDADLKHRLWLSITEGGRAVVLAEVVVNGDNRHYCDEITIPPRVSEALIEYCGLDGESELLTRSEVTESL